MTAAFKKLLAAHAQLEELFALHQDALIDRNPKEALTRLDAYRAALAAHIAEEDDLLPLYERRVGDVPGASAQMISDEHRKIEQLLAQLTDRVAALPDRPGPREIVAIVDLERQYKGLVEHHHLREQNLFYPKLEEALAATKS